MKNGRSKSPGSVPSCRMAPAILGAAVGLAPLLGCVTTHTIAADQLPAALESVPQVDQRRVVKGADGKPVELPSPSHLRWVQVQTGASEVPDEFRPPVSAKVVSGGLLVEGKGQSRTYPLSTLESVRVRHDDHKADTVGGAVLLSIGLSTIAAASLVVAYDFGAFGQWCAYEDECMRGLLSALVAAPVGTVGIGLTAPGIYLLSRGVGGFGLQPKDQTARSSTPQISVGPGSAVVTVPF